MIRLLFWLIAIAVLIRVFNPDWKDHEEAASSCDPSYPTVCIPPPPPDLDCVDVSDRNFRVTGADPHHFDADHDGLGCEPWAPRDD